MKKFQLSKMDVEALSQNLDLFDNAMLKKSAVDVISNNTVGGTNNSDFAQISYVQITFGQVVND
ncbi:hypothetical protein [Pedobacter sp.]|uniref:hypothetical protein n=1 Tax=Pedobacter sp. TaxID=1411316 RepID=UPI003BAD2A36